MSKKKKNYYSKNEDYLFWVTGKISKIIELNTEFKSHFKTVFSIDIPRVNDDKFKMCISWARQVISLGDLVAIKCRYLENAVLVKKLNILRKAEADSETNGNIQDTT